MTWSPVTRRDTFLTRGCNPNVQRGLEIGALNNPIIPPGVGSMKYVDYTDTDGLRRQHENLPDRAAGIVNVDYVWRGSGSLAEVIGEVDAFDYVIASHVIEHVPNTLGWLRGICSVMKPGGVFNLAIPDKRYTFDLKCPLSTLAELIEADMLNYQIPSVRQMFEHTFNIAKIEPGAIWRDDVNVDELEKYNSKYAIYLAHEQAARIANEGAYIDSHCWFYTPASFLELIEGAALLERFDFLLTHIEPTLEGEFEFFVSLQKPERVEGREKLKMEQFGLIQNAKRLVSERQRKFSLAALM
ncbi:Ubiquinone biosynthesis O-methyltransferase [Methylobacterium brachiatum]|nr:Ubiquinone biosynthesis O-methyltransferase [Methylobacterium brachiatum]